MLGAIIGDIVGSIYEWDNIKTKDFPLFGERCYFTDDSVMTIAVADALLRGGTSDDFIDSMKKIGRLYPDAGYGGMFVRWLFSDDREPYNSWGNGSAMRVSPCGWFAESLEEAETLAERSAAVTHDHPEGIKGAQAAAAAIYLARTGKSKEEIKEYIEVKHLYDLSRTLDEIRPIYQFDGSCQGTVPEAIIAFLESTDFEDAIRNAISLGGDSDTLAAITGSIAEAAYGISRGIVFGAFTSLDDTLSAVINTWIDAGKPFRWLEKKVHWRTSEFSKPATINVKFRFSAKIYALLHLGIHPREMEDRWFAYCEDGKLAFHRAWTGFKIYEAEIHRNGGVYEVTELAVERDEEIYYGNDDEDIDFFNYLIGKMLLGMKVSSPLDCEDDMLKGWICYDKILY
jgi:ADP-ribosylglycohydrolase